MQKMQKRILSFVLAASMAIPVGAGNEKPVYASEPQVEVPVPYYEFTFDTEVKNGQVENVGSKSGITAFIDGNGTDLGIVEDAERGSKVLNLPGDGLNKGALLLPENMFQDVTDAGFAFSFWININQSANQYSRIFSATPIELNSDNGSSGWNAPEFTFVAGQVGAADLAEGAAGYHTSVMLPNRTSQLKLVWEQQFARAKWQHVTISVSKSSYDVYLDGNPIAMLYDRNNNKSAILNKLFENNAAVLKTFKHNAIGRSVYLTDNDLKAKIDEFRFYNTALTKEQAKAAYNSYAVSDEGLQALKNKILEGREKSISFYTRDSYDVLKEALEQGEKGIANPVTDANVKRLTIAIENAISHLVYREGVSAETKYSDAQLKEECESAKKILEDGGLAQESEEAIQKTIEEAESAITEKQQEKIDSALLKLRETVDKRKFESTLHFDAAPAKKKGEVFHGSTGFLYGVSEVNVPSADLLGAISPKILVQKAADGKQHPSGDGYRLTPYLKSCGVENIQIYLQDYYLEWPYEYKGIQDYNEKVKQIVTKMVNGLRDEEIQYYSFVIFNEPNSIWYVNDVSRMCKDWLTVYKTIKAINPAIKVAGPNFSSYDGNAYNTFLDYCKRNNCLPEYITWHELSKDKLESFSSHCAQVKDYIELYYADSDFEPVIFVNETVNFDDVGNPGALVNWISIFEEEDVYASLPYWGLANSLNELAADANKPNGAWWVYKWYAQMSGSKAPLSLSDIDAPGAYGRLYGLTSVDEKNSTIHTLFGGQKGRQRVCIENIRSTKIFANADKAHVKIYSTKYTGHQGFAEETPVVFEGNLAFKGDNLIFSISDAALMDAYYAVITPAVGDEVITISDYDKNWEKTYEAEDAQLIGDAKAFTKTGGADLARSNRAEVGGMNSEKDGVQFAVNVPKDGTYKLNIYYSSQAPQVNPLTLEYVSAKGQNRAIGALSNHVLTVDGNASQLITYDSTVKWGYYNYKTVYLDMKAGKHDICLMYKGENQNGKEISSMLCPLLDKIDLTYMADKEAEIIVEPEELVGIQMDFTFSQEGKYTGSGKAVGSGDFDFYVNVPRDGFYKFGSVGSGKAVLAKSRVNYAKDAEAESGVSQDWMNLYNVTLGAENEEKIYLTAGINHLRLSGKNLILDRLTWTEASAVSEGSSCVIEAETGKLSGKKMNDNYSYLLGSAAVPTVIDNKNASGGKAVEGFRGGKNNSLSIKVNVPETGDYKLSVYYANNEPAPVMKTQSGKNYVHPYNTDLVERYMQIEVNGGTPQTVYFKNTFCWDTFKNVVIDVRLNAGENTIRMSNDNSYKFSTVQDDFAPRLDKFIIAPAKTRTDSMKIYAVEWQNDKKQTNTITGVSSKIRKTWGDKTFSLKAKGRGKITYFSSDKKVVAVEKTTGKVTIKGCGKAVVTVKASGDSRYQSATKKITITVVPVKQKIISLQTISKNKFRISWKKDKMATGYQIQYSASRDFQKAKTIWIKQNMVVKKNIALRSAKKYYVRVRSYKKSGNTKVYGKYFIEKIRR